MSNPSSSAATELSPIERLPNELLGQILKDFKPSINPDMEHPQFDMLLEKRVPLLRLALCSKHLNEVTTPAIYSTFVQVGTHSLIGLVRTLLSKPELAHFMKQIFCISGFDYDDTFTENRSQFSDETYNKLLELLHNVGLPYISCAVGLVDDAESGDWDALFALLLCQIHSVEAITLCDHDNVASGEIAWFPQVFAMARLTQSRSREVSSPLTLSKLNFVALYHADPTGQSGFDIGEVTTFLALASVERFFATELVMGDDKGYMDLFNLRGVAFGTKQLHIDAGSLYGGTLVAFLKCFTCLQSLRYTNDMQYWQPFPQKLIEAIAHLKPHLQILELCNNNHGEMNLPIGSLADFKVLKFLSLDQATLLGCDCYDWDLTESESDEDEKSVEEALESNALVDLLPKSIETLAITWSNEDYDLSPEVRSLVQRKEEVAPDLQRILIETEDPESVEEQSHWARLVEDCASAGVKLDLI